MQRVFGIGSVAQVVLGRKNFGEYLSINLGFGFGVMLGIHAAGGISGAHMNASITFANCVVGKPLWRKLPAYVIGQFISDMKNAGALPGTNAFISGLLVVVIGMSMGMNTGYAINPSRDRPPRIFTALAGWGLEVFR
ncbi:aquaporin-7-like [Liasis olivaceus]